MHRDTPRSSAASWWRLSAVLLASLSARAVAGPRLAADPGGLGFNGPTDPQVTALWWNVAALGELPGTHIHLAGSPVFLSERMDLRGAQPQSNLDVQPDLFAGFSTDFATEQVRFGFAYHVPFRDQGSFAASNTPDLGDDGPLRYHRLRTLLRDHYFAVGGAYRVNPSVSFGIGMNLVWSHARLVFDRCAALDQGLLDCTGPATDETIDVHGTSLTVGFQAGFLWRIRGRVTLGGSFQLRPGLSDITADDYSGASRNAQVRRQGATGIEVTQGFGQIHYTLPDILHFGARWLVTDRLEAAAQLRYVDWGNRAGSPEVRLSLPRSPPPAPQPPPGQIRLFRSFRDSVAIRLRGGYCAVLPQEPQGRCRLRLGLLLGFDTGSYSEQGVSADALDGPTVDMGAIFEWRASRHFRFLGGGSYAFMLPRSVTDSVYHPEFTADCAKARFALQACSESSVGRGIPSANGEYGLQSFTASLALAFDFWPE